MKNRGKNCVSCFYRLKASLYLFKLVNKTFLLKNCINCKSSNIIYIIITQRYKEEYIKYVECLVKKQTNIDRQHIIQSQYHQSTIEEHLRTSGDGKFHMFPFFKIVSENNSLRKSYEDYLIDQI